MPLYANGMEWGKPRPQDLREPMRGTLSMLLAQCDKCPPPGRTAVLHTKAADSGSVHSFLCPPGAGCPREAVQLRPGRHLRRPPKTREGIRPANHLPAPQYPLYSYCQRFLTRRMLFSRFASSALTFFVPQILFFSMCRTSNCFQSLFENRRP